MTEAEVKVMQTFPVVALNRPLKVVSLLNDREFTLPANYEFQVTGWVNTYLKLEQIVTTADDQRYMASQADLTDAKAVAVPKKK